MQVKDGGCVKSPFKTFTRPHDGAKKKGERKQIPNLSQKKCRKSRIISMKAREVSNTSKKTVMVGCLGTLILGRVFGQWE